MRRNEPLGKSLYKCEAELFDHVKGGLLPHLAIVLGDLIYERSHRLYSELYGKVAERHQQLLGNGIGEEVARLEIRIVCREDGAPFLECLPDDGCACRSETGDGFARVEVEVNVRRWRG